MRTWLSGTIEPDQLEAVVNKKAATAEVEQQEGAVRLRGEPEEVATLRVVQVST